MTITDLILSGTRFILPRKRVAVSAYVKFSTSSSTNKYQTDEIASRNRKHDFQRRHSVQEIYYWMHERWIRILVLAEGLLQQNIVDNDFG